MSSDHDLLMSFDPHTIEHLGIKMYSNMPNALAEIIANSYDADAENVRINLYQSTEEKIIEIIDDGIGMTFEEINEEYLRIGRNRREGGEIVTRRYKRKVTGKKGLGKLALFGLGKKIEISTIRENSGKKISFILDWDELINTKGMDYKPKYNLENCNKESCGTVIRLSKLNRKSPFNKDQLSLSLSKLFNFFSDKFKVTISINSDPPLLITNKLKYGEINEEFSWSFPGFFEGMNLKFEDLQNITGRVYSTEKPIKPTLRGITLFANGRLVNIPEFFGVSESSHGYSYLTGWLDVDFVDDWREDVISTDRQSLNWDLDKTIELREVLRKSMLELERRWRVRRKVIRNENIQNVTKVNVNRWYKALPNEILNKIEPLVNVIIDKSELDTAEQSSVVKSLHELLPEYPYYHYRHLHTTVQSSSRDDYVEGDYYRAFLETIKRYINDVRSKSSSTNNSDSSMMGEVFGKNNSVLSVTKKYKKPNGQSFNNDTIENIEEGQKFLSMGLLVGARNPLSHEEIKDLNDSNLFNESDCLDALSILSHLFRRLDDSEVN